METWGDPTGTHNVFSYYTILPHMEEERCPGLIPLMAYATRKKAEKDGISHHVRIALV